MQSPTTNVSSNSSETATQLLMADHLKVQQLFQEYAVLKDSGNDDEKSALVKEICRELTVHAQVEEEIVYPVFRQGLEADDLIDEAEEEHAEVKELIAQLESMEPGDDHYDAKVKVMSENIEHHVKEEETEMFPKAQKAKLDTTELGTEVASRKAELLDALEDAES